MSFWKSFLKFVNKLIEMFNKPDKPPEEPDTTETPDTPDTPPDEPDSDLPQNPKTGTNLPNSISEYFTAKKKDYDKSYRISWPSYFSNHMGVGGGSYCTANGLKLRYRNQDKDHGANRPKYQIPQEAIDLNKEILYILYDNSGQTVGWIKTNLTNGKYLPDQK
jgi:hypothetical protein